MPRVKKRHVLSGIKVKEAMRRQVIKLPQSTPIDYCINRMIKYKINAVLLQDDNRQPVGVVSKSDLIVAYKHGVSVDVEAGSVMSTPVKSCPGEAKLSDAIQQMLLRDVQRIFVHGTNPAQIIGVLSLSDAARFRSGSCRACTSSRFIA